MPLAIRLLCFFFNGDRVGCKTFLNGLINSHPLSEEAKKNLDQNPRISNGLTLEEFRAPYWMLFSVCSKYLRSQQGFRPSLVHTSQKLFISLFNIASPFPMPITKWTLLPSKTATTLTEINDLPNHVIDNYDKPHFRSLMSFKLPNTWSSLWNIPSSS